MTPEQQVERGLTILVVAGDEIDARLLNLVCERDGDTQTRFIVVVTCPELTQLHKRALPMVSARGAT